MNHPWQHPVPRRVAAGLAVAIALSGCQVESHKQGGGDNVKIATPFGGMQVKTDKAVVADGLGIPVYPGATPIEKKQNGDDSGAADVNMSFGDFHLGVKAVSYHSDDPQPKIVAFYRDALRKYGDVIQCDHNRPVGTPTRTAQGLTCDNEKNNHITVSGAGSGNIELKTGSQQHQHIVGIDPDHAGFKIGLVALDLPGHISLGDDTDDKQ